MLPRLLTAVGLMALAAFVVHDASPAHAQSTDATLSGLAVEVSSDGTTFTPIGIWPDFAADALEYDTAMPASFTHVRLTPTVNHASATVKVGKEGGTLSPVTSGTASAAIAVDEGFTNIYVEVTAQDGNTRTRYIMGVTRGARGIPAPPRNVRAVPGNGFWRLTWDLPRYWGSWGAGGYEVDWYAGSSPPTQTTDWKRATPLGTVLPAGATSYDFTGTYGDHTVASDQTYYLQVRAMSGTDPDPNSQNPTERLPSVWVVVGATPGQGRCNQPGSTPPGPSPITSAVSAATTITVGWNSPTYGTLADGRKDLITNFLIWVRATDGSYEDTESVKAQSYEPAAYTRTIDGLTPMTEYTLGIRARTLTACYSGWSWRYVTTGGM